MYTHTYVCIYIYIYIYTYIYIYKHLSFGEGSVRGNHLSYTTCLTQVLFKPFKPAFVLASLSCVGSSPLINEIIMIIMIMIMIIIIVSPKCTKDMSQSND